MNFNIVDGDNGYRELLPEFSKLYNDDYIPVTEIMDRLGLNMNTYRKLRRDAIEEDLVIPRRAKYKKKISYKINPKYISKAHRGRFEYYRVVKRIDSKVLYFGYFKDYRQAERMVELLKENDWDISLRTKLKEQVLREWNCRK